MAEFCALGKHRRGHDHHGDGRLPEDALGCGGVRRNLHRRRRPAVAGGVELRRNVRQSGGFVHRNAHLRRERPKSPANPVTSSRTAFSSRRRRGRPKFRAARSTSRSPAKSPWASLDKATASGTLSGGRASLGDERRRRERRQGRQRCLRWMHLPRFSQPLQQNPWHRRPRRNPHCRLHRQPGHHLR